MRSSPPSGSQNCQSPTGSPCSYQPLTLRVSGWGPRRPFTVADGHHSRYGPLRPPPSSSSHHILRGLIGCCPHCVVSGGQYAYSSALGSYSTGGGSPGPTRQAIATKTRARMNQVRVALRVIACILALAACPGRSRGIDPALAVSLQERCPSRTRPGTRRVLGPSLSA